VDDPGTALEDPEEWLGVTAAGFDGDPNLGACIITVGQVGQIWVVVEFADGVRRMSDKHADKSIDQLEGAIAMDLPYHPNE